MPVRRLVAPLFAAAAGVFRPLDFPEAELRDPVPRPADEGRPTPPEPAGPAVRRAPERPDERGGSEPGPRDEGDIIQRVDRPERKPGQTLRTPEDSRLQRVRTTVVDWFARHARDLPWRAAGTSAWGILVSEVMSQQTPMVRVAPRWTEWMDRWPTPADLAAASPAEVLLAWDTLGYPRRALRLRETAVAIAEEHGNTVPVGEAALRALPGVGDYTAAAVTSFAHRAPATVLDVNIRRVLGRVFAGRSHPTPAPTRRERDWAAALVPGTGHVEWNAGLMELGALVCTSRNPDCAACPLRGDCDWYDAGRPIDPARRPSTQTWHGTDRQLRGAIMAALRADPDTEVPVALLVTETADLDPEALTALPDPVEAAVLRVRALGSAERVARLVAALVADGLAERTAGDAGEERLRLPR